MFNFEYIIIIRFVWSEIMKKMLFLLVIVLVIIGCGGGEILEDVKNDILFVILIVIVKFDFVNSVILVFNDLLMSGIFDGILNMLGELDDNNVSVECVVYVDF